jgi:subtilisin-like proprotein convertase family protein
MSNRIRDWRRVALAIAAVAGMCSETALAANEAEPRPFASVGVSKEANPLSLAGNVMSIKDVDIVRTDVLDFEAAIQESARMAETGGPLRFAIPVESDYTVDNSGTWETLPGGKVLWRLRVASPGALSLNIGFTRYSMPDGGTMTLLTTDGREVMRPFTAKDNAPSGELWTPILNAEEIIIEVELPDEKAAGNLDIQIGRINAGFRHFGGPTVNERGTSGSCNVDTACSQGDPWRDEIAASGAYSVNGVDACSGSMINNTAQNRVPYFLTAFHCNVNASNAASVVIYWNFQNSYCRVIGSPDSGGAGDGPLSQFSSGTTFRAGSSPSDFTLLQVNTAPNPAWGVTFAGWSRADAFPPSGACIHHPRVAEKRITFYDIAVRPTRPTHGSSWGCSAFPGPGDSSHIAVYWSLGVTEPGSSGSPLFDNNQRIIGQLHGGPSSCSQTGDGLSDCYGRVFRSWTGGGTAATRLSDWLDPGNTGATFIDTLGKGLDVSPATDTTHLGLVGGPFTPASISYTLGNTTPTAINYSVAIVGGGTAPLTLDGGAGPLSGTIPPSSSVTVVVAVDASANSLPSGLYASTVRFDDLSNGVTINRVHTIDAGTTNFTVTPASGLAAGGPVGGPFSSTQTYIVTSTKPTPVTIQAAGSASWIAVDGNPSNTFTLSGVGATQNVVVGYSAAANALAAGIYNANVAFTNLTNAGIGDTTRPVTIDVGRYSYSYPGPGISIPDNNATGITSTVNVADNFCIGDLDAVVNLTHTFIGDLIVELVSPGGVVVRLHNRTGGSADNIFRTYDQGVLNPDGPGALTDFNGRGAQGTWTLRVSDVASTDIGTLDNWTLRIAQSGTACPPTANAQSITVPDTITSPITLTGLSATGAPLTYSIASLPANGTLRDPTGNVLISTVPYTLASGAVVNYKPNSLFVGNDSFAFYCTDASNSANATVSVRVGFPAPVVTWNMTTNPGWTFDSGWEYGAPQGLGGDPAAGFTGTNIVGYNLAGAYPNNLTPRRYATTPAFNMTGKLFSTLSFQRWLGVESSTFDKAGIEISNDGGATWAPIWSNPAATLNESAWGLQTYDISAAADNRPDVRLRWYLGTTDGSVTFEGWNIDDVAVSAVSPPTAPAPCTGDADGDRDVDFSDITAVLGNFGLTPGAFGPGDADGNGTVEFADITTVLANFGIPCP